MTRKVLLLLKQITDFMPIQVGIIIFIFGIVKDYLVINLIFFSDSQLQISLLALFSELNCKFSNLVVGLITRDSIREAFQMGITAQQVFFDSSFIFEIKF